jgi:hypothetical protein
MANPLGMVVTIYTSLEDVICFVCFAILAGSKQRFCPQDSDPFQLWLWAVTDLGNVMILSSEEHKKIK